MPGEVGDGTREEPVDLGDPTANSWALIGELKPGDVKHFKFNIPGPTKSDSPSTDRFYMGLYVPGAGEPDFTYYVAIFGMRRDTECERWGDGWGRRSLGSGDAPHRVTSAGSTWLLDSTEVPERVKGYQDACKFSSECFDYHDVENTLVFIASPSTDKPNKFESFSPTLFKPRGSCIADFPRGGEYRIAIWGEETQDRPRKLSLGLGLAERDVFAPETLVQFDYILFGVQTWNGWSGFVLILPMLLFAIAAVGFLVFVRHRKPDHYGTETGATPFRALVLLASSLLLGHVVMNIAILAWATGNAHVESARELTFPIVMSIALPTISGALSLLVGLNVPICCCCGPSSAHASAGVRCAALGFGVLHLFMHAGYLVASALLILAALLPPSLANKGLPAGSSTAKPITESSAIHVTPSTATAVPKTAV